VDFYVLDIFQCFNLSTVFFHITASHIDFRFLGANVLPRPRCFKLSVEVDITLFNMYVI
jgi:hypothetical protein